MTGDTARLVPLAIYLVKQGREKPRQAIKNIGALANFKVSDDGGVLGTLYVENRKAKPPGWAKFFSSQVSANKLGKVSSTAAVLHVVVDGRAFLLTFGQQGRFLIDPECYEERFGLLVTLNSIGESVRSIDKHALDTFGRHTRVQASKEASPSEFGLDIERDLLRAITGTPTDVALGKTMAGYDSLHVLARVDLSSLRDLLSRYLTQFAKDTYKQTFPWVDHIGEVKEPGLKATLDGLMLAAVQTDPPDRCWFAVPEPIEWNRVAGFRFRQGTKHAIVHDISIQAFIEDSGIRPQDITIDLLHERSVMAVNGDDMKMNAWSVYRCVYCEVEHGDDTFLLTGGKWYRIETDFVRQVNEFFANVPRADARLQLPLYDDATEGAYNARVAEADPVKYALMDEKHIMMGGGHSKVEFCDLLANGRVLIHVKRYGGAGVLSHLFSQGMVSGQLFVSDGTFRQKVNEKLPEAFRLRDPAARPNPGDYQIIFAVVSRESGDKLTLPFFSRLTTRYAVQNLNQGFGYNVALAKIHVTEERAKTKRYTSAKRRGRARTLVAE